jgi:hypothetical protein
MRCNLNSDIVEIFISLLVYEQTGNFWVVILCNLSI